MPFFLGVEIFFVISGYLVTLSLSKDEFHGPHFFVKRVFRLMPAVLVFLVFTLALNVFIADFRRGEMD